MCSLLLFSQTPSGCQPSGAYQPAHSGKPPQMCNMASQKGNSLERTEDISATGVSSPDLDQPEAVISSSSATSKYIASPLLHTPPSHCFKYWRWIMVFAFFPGPGKELGDGEVSTHSCKSTCMLRDTQDASFKNKEAMMQLNLIPSEWGF